MVISEIMWGRDASLGGDDAAKSQWIELYNMTDAAISIDKYEWVLAFTAGAGTGTTETFGLTLIDTVSNASPYFPAPGNSGATLASRQVDVKGGTDGEQVVGAVVENFNPNSLVSMYRKIDGTTAMDGTMASSWAASMTVDTRNLSGLRVGTPGAMTPYTPAPTPPPTPPPMAPTATASDLMITEIMVASNEGRLPQWIEITNTSVAEVSLDGWSLGIDNDPADATVVAPSLGIKLDGVTLDAGHSALVVSKNKRFPVSTGQHQPQATHAHRGQV